MSAVITWAVWFLTPEPILGGLLFPSGLSAAPSLSLFTFLILLSISLPPLLLEIVPHSHSFFLFPLFLSFLSFKFLFLPSLSTFSFSFPSLYPFSPFSFPVALPTSYRRLSLLQSRQESSREGHETSRIFPSPSSLLISSSRVSQLFATGNWLPLLVSIYVRMFCIVISVTNGGVFGGSYMKCDLFVGRRG